MRMKSWHDMTEQERATRMAIEPLSASGVGETFRHPASYAELRLVKTIWRHVDEADRLRTDNEALRKALGAVVQAADEMLAGGEQAIRHAEQCGECGSGGVGPLRDALNVARPALLSSSHAEGSNEKGAAK